jgi:hypothetical protein
MQTPCEMWLQNPIVNPYTGRRIKPYGPTYNKLSDTCGPCDRWFDAPRVNPYTGRTIKRTGPTYSKLKRTCGSPQKVALTVKNTNLLKGIKYDIDMANFGEAYDKGARFRHLIVEKEGPFMPKNRPNKPECRKGRACKNRKCSYSHPCGATVKPYTVDFYHVPKH